jgi:RNA polymerase sigma-70 factor (ECF subfamily)
MEQSSAEGLRDAEDIVWLQEMAAGNMDALQRLYNRYAGGVLALARRIVGDGETAEEVTQEAFVRLWRYAPQFRADRGRVSTWLLRITRNLALNELRRRRSRPQVADVALASGEPDSGDEERGVAERRLIDVADDRANPEAMVLSQWQREAVLRALSQLPLVQREAIELAFFQGLTQVEIAATLGDPLGTVKSRIRLGMQRLKALLLEQGLGEIDGLVKDT